jgi:hypothetical protein
MKRNAAARELAEELAPKRFKPNVDRDKTLDTFLFETVEGGTGVSSLELTFEFEDVLSIILKMLDPVFAYSFKLISKRYFEITGKILSDPSFSIEAVSMRRCAPCGNLFEGHSCKLNNAAGVLGEYHRRDLEFLLDAKGYDGREIRKIMTCETLKPTIIFYASRKNSVVPQRYDIADLQRYDVADNIISINGGQFVREVTMACKKISFCHYGSRLDDDDAQQISVEITLKKSIDFLWDNIGNVADLASCEIDSLGPAFFKISTRIVIDYYFDSENDGTSYFRCVRLGGPSMGPNGSLEYYGSLDNYGVEDVRLTWTYK